MSRVLLPGGTVSACCPLPLDSHCVLTFFLEHVSQDMPGLHKVWVVDELSELVLLRDRGAGRCEVLGELQHHLSADAGTTALHAGIVEHPELGIVADATEQAHLLAKLLVQVVFAVPALVVLVAHEPAQEASKSGLVEVGLDVQDLDDQVQVKFTVNGLSRLVL